MLSLEVEVLMDRNIRRLDQNIQLDVQVFRVLFSSDHPVFSLGARSFNGSKNLIFGSKYLVKYFQPNREPLL